ncbi:ankyrin repeat domain-containing protein, partial [Hyaloscypha variabilis F]
LLKKGADPNAEHERQGNMLQLAIQERCQANTVRWLLEAGADVNAGGKYGSALQAACTTSRSQVVEDLLSRGAKALLARDADINLAGGHYGFALQAAACSDRCDPGDIEVLRFLLENGADVNALGGEYGTALQAAAFHHKQYVDVLLDFGADPSIEGGKYGSAIGAAMEKGWSRVVNLLR